jgi:hypothetical protein
MNVLRFREKLLKDKPFIYAIIMTVIFIEILK